MPNPFGQIPLIDQLIQAARRGDFEAVKTLVHRCDPRDCESEALWMAAKKGHADCLALLIPVSDLSARGFEALRVAAAEGHPDCVRLLLAGADTAPLALTQALGSAAFAKSRECVDLLLPLCDPKAEFSLALRHAAAAGSQELVELLLPLSDPSAAPPDSPSAAEEARDRGHHALGAFIDSYELAQEENAALSQAAALAPPKKSPAL